MLGQETPSGPECDSNIRLQFSEPIRKAPSVDLSLIHWRAVHFIRCARLHRIPWQWNGHGGLSRPADRSQRLSLIQAAAVIRGPGPASADSGVSRCGASARGADLPQVQMARPAAGSRRVPRSQNGPGFWIRRTQELRSYRVLNLIFSVSRWILGILGPIAETMSTDLRDLGS